MIKPTSIIGLILFGVLVYAVFHVEHRVEMLRGELIAINGSVKQDKEAIHVLDAEWSYLNQPQRLEQMSEQYLSLSQLEGGQIRSINDIPLRSEGELAQNIIEASEVALSQR